MKRSDFLKLLLLSLPVSKSFSTLTPTAMKIKEFENISNSFISTERMPVLFIGHGHPMNALFDNTFTQTLQQIGKTIQKPNAIMVISAHWETKGTFVSVNPLPHTIYDFGGFDEKLFQVKYEPAGHPALAREVIQELPLVQEDREMGLDHGAWTVLKFIYPNADIPVFQLSIDYTQSPAKHFEMAQALKKMREKGVLIVGSGNIVHNLRRIDFHNINGKTEDWAIEFDDIVKNKLNQQEFSALVDYKRLGSSAAISVPTEDHYLPLIYTLGLASSNEQVRYLYEGFQFANISMRCFRIG
jgi:4,5-DOPA dioxygenase extradiol